MARKKKGGRGSGVTAAGGGSGRVGTQGGQSSGSNRQQRGPQRQNGATQVRNTERHRDNTTAAASHVGQNGRQENAYMPQELNGQLLAFQHPVHLQVPEAALSLRGWLSKG
jgi:hypothetical protein